MPQRIACLLMLLAAVAPAQSTTESQNYLAHLVTFSPGSIVYERFGHNAIFISDLTASPPVTIAYDFGNFDFDESDFIRRFVFGRMRYWAAAKSAEEMLTIYRADNRQTYTQQLELTDAQVLSLWRNLEDNVREENRFYTYNYYTDNCSTRLRDHIDRVLGGQLAEALRGRAANHDFRWHTRIGLDSQRLLLTGVELVLSGFVDRPISAWEETFVPEQLRLHLEGVRVRLDDGSLAPLVRRSGLRNIYLDEATAVRLPDRPPSLAGWYALAGVVAGGLMALVGWSATVPRARSSRWFSAVVWLVWGLAAFTAAVVMLFLWFLTDHVAAYRNENLLQLSPLALGLIAVAPAAGFARWLPAARWLAGALLGMALLGLILKILPWLRQDNWRILAFTIPAHIGLFLGVVLRGGRARLPTKVEAKV